MTEFGEPFTRQALCRALDAGILTLHGQGDGRYSVRVGAHDVVTRGDTRQRFILDLRDAQPEPRAQRELLPPSTRGTMAPSMMPTFDDVCVLPSRARSGPSPSAMIAAVAFRGGVEPACTGIEQPPAYLAGTG